MIKLDEDTCVFQYAGNHWLCVVAGHRFNAVKRDAGLTAIGGNRHVSEHFLFCSRCGQIRSPDILGWRVNEVTE